MMMTLPYSVRPLVDDRGPRLQGNRIITRGQLFERVERWCRAPPRCALASRRGR